MIITKEYDDVINSDITRDDRDEIVITKGYESYNQKLQERKRSYRREREVIGEKEKELKQQVQIDYQECYQQDEEEEKEKQQD